MRIEHENWRMMLKNARFCYKQQQQQQQQEREFH